VASLLCVCDNLIDMSPVPNPNGYAIIKESDLSALESTDKVSIDELYKTIRWSVKCPYCGRLWLFNPGYDTEPELYEQIPIPD
jgi:hypothetical protein